MNINKTRLKKDLFDFIEQNKKQKKAELNRLIFTKNVDFDV